MYNENEVDSGRKKQQLKTKKNQRYYDSTRLLFCCNLHATEELNFTSIVLIIIIIFFVTWLDLNKIKITLGTPGFVVTYQI